MKPLAKAELINIQELYSEFVFELGNDAALALLAAEGEQVDVLSEETDGYWNIRLPNGMEVTGISWYHLSEFNESTTAEKRITTLKDFILEVEQLRDVGDAYELFEDETSEEVRNLIYGLSTDPEELEPFRFAMRLLGYPNF